MESAEGLVEVDAQFSFSTSDLPFCVPCLEFIVFRYHYKLGNGKRTMFNFCLHGLTMLAVQNKTRRLRPESRSSTKPWKWVTCSKLNFHFYKKDRTEGREQKKTSSKNDKASRHHSGHLGTPWDRSDFTSTLRTSIIVLKNIVSNCSRVFMFIPS